MLSSSKYERNRYQSCLRSSTDMAISCSSTGIVISLVIYVYYLHHSHYVSWFTIHGLKLPWHLVNLNILCSQRSEIYTHLSFGKTSYTWIHYIIEHYFTKPGSTCYRRMDIPGPEEKSSMPTEGSSCLTRFLSFKEPGPTTIWLYNHWF